MAVTITDAITKRIQRGQGGRSFLATDIDRIILVINKTGNLIQIQFFLRDSADSINFPPEDLQAFKNAGIISEL